MPIPPRKPLIVANWKMHGDHAMAESLCRALTNHDDFAALDSANPAVEIVLCPPYTLLYPVATWVTAHAYRLGAQDMDEHANGAYSGQISATMLRDCGCRYVILGHSERRQHHHETDAQVARKVAQAVASGLTALVCVGETAAQRQAGTTLTIIAAQLQAVLSEVGITAFAQIGVAYEPIWAIGSGQTATPDQAQQVHSAIRQQLAREDAHIAEHCRLLYGGSMNAANAAALLVQPDIDGGLIGGASLHAEDFLTICQIAHPQ